MTNQDDGVLSIADAEINETIIDLTGLLGTGPYRAGTPQRQKLNHRITE
jgi:site-specific DNA recombinase